MSKTACSCRSRVLLKALSVKLYRTLKTAPTEPEQALTTALRDYQPPVPPAIILAQIALAVAEATDLSFVPERFRSSTSIS
jgi:hypothetical protein